MPILETMVIGAAVNYLRENAGAIAQQVQFEIRKKITEAEHRQFTVAAGMLSDEDGRAVNDSVKTWLHDAVHFDSVSLKTAFAYLSQYCGLVAVQSDGLPVIGQARAGWKVVQLRNPMEAYREKNEDCFGFQNHVMREIDDYYSKHDKMSIEKAYVTILDNYIQLFLGLMNDVQKMPSTEGEGALNELENQLNNFLDNFQKGPAQQRSFSLLNRMAEHFDLFKTQRFNLVIKIKPVIKKLFSHARDEQKRTIYDIATTLHQNMVSLSNEMRGFVVRHLTGKDQEKDLFAQCWESTAEMLSVGRETMTLEERFLMLETQKKLSSMPLATELMSSITAAIIFSEEVRRILMRCFAEERPVNANLIKAIAFLEHDFNQALLAFKNNMSSVVSTETVTVHCHHAAIGINQAISKSANDSVAVIDRKTADIHKLLSEIKTALQSIAVDASASEMPINAVNITAKPVLSVPVIVHPVVASAKAQFSGVGGLLLLKNANVDLTVDSNLIERKILRCENNQLHIQLDHVLTEGDVICLSDYLLEKLNLGRGDLTLEQEQSKGVIMAFQRLDPLTTAERFDFSKLSDWIKYILNAESVEAEKAGSFLHAIANHFHQLIESVLSKKPVGYRVFQQNLHDAEFKARQICEEAKQFEKIKEIQNALDLISNPEHVLSVLDYCEKIKKISNAIFELERLPYKTQALEESIVLLNIQISSAQENYIQSFVYAFETYFDAFERLSALYQESVDQFNLDELESKLLEIHEKLIELTKLKNALFTFDFQVILDSNPKIFEMHDRAVNTYQLFCRQFCEKQVKALEEKIKNFSECLLSDSAGFDLVLSTRLFLEEANQDAVSDKNQSSLEKMKCELEVAIESCILKISATLKTLNFYFGESPANEFDEDIIAIKKAYSDTLFICSRDELVEILNGTLKKILY